jgi:hypothetical protein
MPTLLELAQQLNRNAAEMLERNVLAMPEEKLTWKPLDEGRTALDQLAECALFTFFNAKVLRERAVPEFNREEYARRKAEIDTRDKALGALHAGMETLLQAIAAFPESDLDQTIEMFGGTQTYAEIALFSYWNKVYHIGQISYIQTLYGDKEMH